MKNMFKHNHYVPEWFQKRFIVDHPSKYHYLDMNPEVITNNGHSYTRHNIWHRGPFNCFAEEDLYTTKWLDIESTEIEEKFFGDIDRRGKVAVEFFSEFNHQDIEAQAFRDLMIYMSTQRLRTPKGLRFIAKLVGHAGKNAALFKMQEIQELFCAVWTESVWQIGNCTDSNTNFIISDNPVTFYNKGMFPASQAMAKYGDPAIWLNGTHTIFPLSATKILILTNLSWLRNPYGSPLKPRPNYNPFRKAIFNFEDIQIMRNMDEGEVREINYIIKSRAQRYIAAGKREWLYPEKFIGRPRWDRFGENYLLMPDPRSIFYGGEIVIGYQDGTSETFDEYGNMPEQKDFKKQNRDNKEWESFMAFQGQYARLFGAKRRGISMQFGRLSNEVDPDEIHQSHLRQESKFRKYRK